MSLPVSILLGLVLSFVIGLFAYQRGSLTRGGVVGAILTGTAIVGFGGFVPGFLLVAFFVSSSLLSKYQARAKQSVNEKFQKGSRRDFGQAMANGGWAAVLAIALGLAPLMGGDARTQQLLFAAFVGAIATVTADTWATEIGVLSRTMPRMITTWRLVPVGTSGGITLPGTITALIGAMFIGAMVNTADVFWFVITDFARAGSVGADVFLTRLASGVGIIFVASSSGLAGALFDSLLGATVQGIYFSEYDEWQTEKAFDSQGSPTRLIRGVGWFDNDWVNFISSVFGSLVAAGISFLIL